MRQFLFADFLATVKRYTPTTLHPVLRSGYRLGKSIIHQLRGGKYRDRLQHEVEFFSGNPEIMGLPPVALYWAEKYLAPMLRPLGFSNSIELFRQYILKSCQLNPQRTTRVASLGCGDCRSEINIAEWLLEQNCTNFSIECLDLTPVVLKRAQTLAEERKVASYFEFSTFDINRWRPSHRYDVIIAFQSIHHVLGLEDLFRTIQNSLSPAGRFLIDDMIGRNGHQRWPEALHIVEGLWKEMPERYKYNHQFGRVVDPYENFDCSQNGFEGIRAQDILPLLMRHFHFEIFAAFGNVIDLFIDRAYGYNFNMADPADVAFIDRIHDLDTRQLDAGILKPTHLMAAMSVDAIASPRTIPYRTPEFCVRKVSTGGYDESRNS